MKNEFNNVGIIGRESTGVIDTFCSLRDFLLERKVNVILGENIVTVISDSADISGLEICSRDEMGEKCDLIIVIGGDGSLLGAARMLARHDKPVLGVNRGRLGFLTDVLPDDIHERVGAVLDGEYVKEERFLLDVELHRDGEIIGRGEALNDVVVNSGTSAQMMEFGLYIDNEFVCQQRADGLIVSTPTGSTAYSLSAGGPIMHPKLDAIVLVPMFPHTLSSRPIVVDGESELVIDVSESNALHPPVICDGQEYLSAKPGDKVTIRKKPHRLSLIHPTGHSFYASCRDKLGWNTRLT